MLFILLRTVWTVLCDDVCCRYWGCTELTAVTCQQYLHDVYVPNDTQLSIVKTYQVCFLIYLIVLVFIRINQNTIRTFSMRSNSVYIVFWMQRYVSISFWYCFVSHGIRSHIYKHTILYVFSTVQKSAHWESNLLHKLCQN